MMTLDEIKENLCYNDLRNPDVTVDEEIAKDNLPPFTPRTSGPSLMVKLKFDKDNLADSHMNFEIDVSSINTGNGMKNKKAMTSEWFDQANHPKITFVSSKLEKTDKGYFVQGNLTMKGTKRYRKIPVAIDNTSSGLKLTGTFWVERSYYKIGKPSGEVPDKMKITYSIPVK